MKRVKSKLKILETDELFELENVDVKQMIAAEHAEARETVEDEYLEISTFDSALQTGDTFRILGS